MSVNSKAALGLEREWARPIAHDFVHKQDESMQAWSQGLYLLSLPILHTSCTELTVTKIRPKNNCRPQRCLSAERFICHAASALDTCGQGRSHVRMRSTCHVWQHNLSGVQLLFTSLHWTLCDVEYYTSCSPIHMVLNRTAGFTLLMFCNILYIEVLCSLRWNGPGKHGGVHFRWQKVVVLGVTLRQIYKN